MKNLIIFPFSKYAEKAEEIPTEIQKYINSESKTDGLYFKFVKGGKSEDTGHGMSYYDQLQIFIAGQEKPIYDTGLILYRDGRPFTTDRWDLCIDNIKIIDESPQKVVYGYSNGTGQMYIAQCTNEGVNSRLMSFDMKKREATLKNQLEPTNEKSFRDWVYRHIGESLMHADVYHDSPNLCVVIARHCSRSVDATHDWYQIFVWKKGEGIAKSDRVYTGARTSYSKYSTNYLRSNISIDSVGNIQFNARSEFGDVHFEETYFLESKQSTNSFTKQATQAIAEVVKNHQHNHPLYKPTCVKESVIDENLKIAVFILFEQIDTDRNTEVGEGWLGDQFRYSLWKINGDKPIQLYEDHAYIRPRSKSELTGTRGQECSLKDLKVEGQTIKVTHLKGHVEKLETEELTFNL